MHILTPPYTSPPSFHSLLVLSCSIVFHFQFRMGFSLEYCSSLAVAQVIGRAALHVHTVALWMFSSFLALCPSSFEQNRAGGGSRPSRCSASAKAIRESLHVLTYGEIIASGHHHINDDCDQDEKEGEDGGSATCAVCLNGVRMQDEVRELRNCRHVFHRGCLDRWLDHDEHGTCPLCRAPLLLPTPPSPPPPPAEPSWAVDRLLYLFGDDLMPCFPSSS